MFVTEQRNGLPPGDPTKLGYLTVWAADGLLRPAASTFAPGSYDVGAPVGTVQYFSQNEELALGQPLHVTRANIGKYAGKWEHRDPSSADHASEARGAAARSRRGASRSGGRFRAGALLEPASLCCRDSSAPAWACWLRCWRSTSSSTPFSDRRHGPGTDGAVESGTVEIKLDLLQQLKHGPEILIPRQLAIAPGRARVPADADRPQRGSTRGSPAAPRPTSTCSFASPPRSVPAPAAPLRVVPPTSDWRAVAWAASAIRRSPCAALPAGVAGFGLGDVKTYLSTDATKVSWRVFRKCVLGSCRSRIHYNPDGSLTNQSLHYLPEHAKSLQKSVAKLIAGVRHTPRDAGAGTRRPGYRLGGSPISSGRSSS